MSFTPEEKEGRRKRVFEAMGGWYGEHEIQAIVSDKAKLVSTIAFFQKQIDKLEKEFDDPNMTNRGAQSIERLQTRNRKFLKVLRAFLEIVEEGALA